MKHGNKIPALLGVACCAMAPAAFGLPDTPFETTYGTNGTVRAIATTSDTVYLGGDFTELVPPNTAYGGPIDLASGTPAAPFPQTNNMVYAATPDGSGGWFFGGMFQEAGGSPAHWSIAHSFADGSVDPTWNATADGTIAALAVIGSTLYLGGHFNNVNGLGAPYLAGLDVATGALTWSGLNLNDNVQCLAVSGSTLYFGGNFMSVAGAQRWFAAAVDTTTGSLAAWNPMAQNTVYEMAISGSTVYMAGNFTWVNYVDSFTQTPRNYLAAVDATTAVATAWDPNPSATGPVYALVVSGGVVYAGGYFTQIGGQVRDRIAALDPTTGLATAWNPDADNIVYSLALSGTTLYLGGEFHAVGGQARNHLAAVDTTTGLVTDWVCNADDQVSTLTISGATMFAGGAFSTICRQPRNYIAALDRATGLPTAWNPDANNQVHALAATDTTVYVGGLFNTLGGTTRNRIAALDAATGVPTAWNPSASSDVYTLALSGSTVYAGGAFATIGGKTRNNIAALRSSTGSATAWNPNANQSVHALAVSGSTVYAGGSFTNIGGQTRNHLAAIDAGTGQATAWHPNANGYVYALAVSGSAVYAGGSFSTIGGELRYVVAALDPTTGLATDWNPSPDIGPVSALAISGSTVYIGGRFLYIGGQARSCLAAVDAESGAVTAWDPSADGTLVRVLAVSRGAVYAGGDFTTMGGTARPYFAQFSPPLVLLTPNGGEEWALGGTHDIEWAEYGLTGDVRLYLYDTGVGHGWKKIRTLATVPVADGAWTWNIPADDPGHDNYRVRVHSQTQRTVSDYSDDMFSLTGGGPAALTLTVPNGGEEWAPGTTQTIKWDADNLGGYVRLYLYDGYTKVRALGDAWIGAGQWKWAIPGDEPALATYRVRVQSLANPALSDYGDRMFGIGTDLELTSPNGGDAWARGYTYPITWTSTGPLPDVNILLYNNWTRIRSLATVPASAGTWTWNIPVDEPLLSTYRIRLQTANNGLNDYSDGVFSVVSATPTLTVVWPNTGFVWQRGTDQCVQWLWTNLSGEVRVYLYDNWTKVRTLGTFYVTDRWWDWSIPANEPPGSTYRIRVQSLTNTAINDYGGLFTIAP